MYYECLNARMSSLAENSLDLALCVQLQFKHACYKPESFHVEAFDSRVVPYHRIVRQYTLCHSLVSNILDPFFSLRLCLRRVVEDEKSRVLPVHISISIRHIK